MVFSTNGSGLQKQRAKRYPVRLTGRYLLADRTEWQCHSIDISPTGILIHGLAKPYHGQKIVIYLEEIGRLEGVVVRLKPEGFALSIHATDRKREQLAMLLDKIAKGEGAPRRSHEGLLADPAKQTKISPSKPIEPPAKPLKNVTGKPSPAGYSAYLDWL